MKKQTEPLRCVRKNKLPVYLQAGAVATNFAIEIRFCFYKRRKQYILHMQIKHGKVKTLQAQALPDSGSARGLPYMPVCPARAVYA